MVDEPSKIIVVHRKRIEERKDWKNKISQLGLTFHTEPDGSKYWNEGIYLELRYAETERIKKATEELYQLCLKAVQFAIADPKTLRLLRIPENFWAYLRDSWNTGEHSVFGRFDLTVDNQGNIKMYEFNADTPVGLLESSIIQNAWQNDSFPKCFQFNKIHQNLVTIWKKLKSAGYSIIHFTCADGMEEEFRNLQYLMNTATEAGIECKQIYLKDLGWNGNTFLDLEDKPIATLLKLYPWEWMIQDAFGVHLLKKTVKVIEPPWKMILSNKGILPLLWSLFPNHPNLLAAFWTKEEADRNFGQNYVEKPLFGRAGANIFLHTNQIAIKNFGPYSDDDFIFQHYCSSLLLDGKYVTIGSWIVGDECSGLAFFEDDSPIIGEACKFDPHVVV